MKAIVAALMLVVPPSGLLAAEDAPDPGRLLETLVRQTLCGPDIADPSPTRLLRELLRAEPVRLRAVLRETWEARHLLDFEAARAFEEVAQLLFGLGPDGRRSAGGRPPAGGLWEFDGALLARTVRHGERWAGPFAGEDLPPFDAHLGARDLRAPPEPARLLAALAAGAPERWGEAERLSFALALGEGARQDPAVRAGLLAAARAAPRDRLLAVALGSLGGPEAAALLAERLRGAVPRREGFSEDFRELGRCLERADPDGPRAVFRVLAEPERGRALGCAGLELALPSVLRDFEAATEPAARAALLAEMRDLLERGSYGYTPARELPRALRMLVEALDSLDGAERQVAMAVAARLAGVRGSYRISGSSVTDGDEVRESGWSIGPPQGVEPLLRTLASDLAAGRLVPLEGPRDERRWGQGPLLSPPPEPVKCDGSRAHAAVPCPEPNLSEPDPEFPVQAVARFRGESLVLSIRNLGSRTFLVNPVALRYATAQATTVEVSRAGGEPEEATQLGLEFGTIPAGLAVPAAELVPVEPGGARSFTLFVLPKLRGAKRIVISLSAVPIAGRADHPVLRTINETWIR
ncbi:MAG: hypothetical protein MUE73_01345 [Planctomycetes bacterium]|nr:hypothetical protein [Planctomycetota bacterium]